MAKLTVVLFFVLQGLLSAQEKVPTIDWNTDPVAQVKAEGSVANPNYMEQSYATVREGALALGNCKVSQDPKFLRDCVNFALSFFGDGPIGKKRISLLDQARERRLGSYSVKYSWEGLREHGRALAFLRTADALRKKCEQIGGPRFPTNGYYGYTYNYACVGTLADDAEALIRIDRIRSKLKIFPRDL
ncbi:MAG: hypothetical protein A3J74_04125 [Elusimicrobia bacterium RIFCSPHIGHO2_02_FULL_57_9]|nr:MAG: hypothetical protein A3J74_04125 [Elusimicrobia bacterium RIFCSPHIGHO2_02_FULL_57_9]